MKYTDLVLGESEITEPVILELINSPSLQRLKKINQVGYGLDYALREKLDVKTDEYDHNRFAHSVGVYLLLHKYNAPLEEQIAGLIHDVSHSAFSHCIDYVLDAGSEQKHNHQDNIFESFVRKTEIPEIIKKYGLDLEYILNDKNFPLKERSLPDLCADRINYSLISAIIYGELNDDDKKYLLDNLTVENNNWVFKNFESAKKYAELFLKLNTVYYAGLPSAVMFRTVGDCLRYALQRGYISLDDLYTTDKLVLEKVQNFLDKDKKLKLLWERMNNKVKVSNDPNNWDSQVFCKSRAVDPLFSSDGKLLRISEVEKEWSDIIREESKPKKYFLKFDR
ncbi:HD domain-containing protein [Candidatus Parcubacteria bacterium]|uniref:HD/PDEase domain-containing protein n=1 Tax=Candidatus Berkelbacteria bacterium CG_4_10_14_0_8_um_filter_42_34 TaxID=1974502 RepID=A0A2M7SW38_9BACT|nr:HD domain-containing protein [Candidatus Parcubacteria bacterium]PIZ27391.1 MAG: hypothetical protein COY45_02710 [Candidatus Berkelbacteria bacterium CG_4_10_14_0_8_um_filter_42_34]